MNYGKKKNAYFEEVYCQNVQEVYKTSLYFVKDEDAAKDITQKAFFQAYLHLENIEPGSVRAYVYRTAHNQALNWLRYHKRLRDGIIKEVSETDAALDSVEDDYIRDECHRAVHHVAQNILSALYLYNEGWYEAILKVYYLEYSHEETAAQLGITKEQLFSRLYRAKKWIRKHYQRQYDQLRREIWY